MMLKADEKNPCESNTERQKYVNKQQREKLLGRSTFYVASMHFGSRFRSQLVESSGRLHLLPYYLFNVLSKFRAHRTKNWVLRFSLSFILSENYINSNSKNVIYFSKNSIYSLNYYNILFLFSSVVFF